MPKPRPNLSKGGLCGALHAATWICGFAPGTSRRKFPWCSLGRAPGSRTTPATRAVEPVTMGPVEPERSRTPPCHLRNSWLCLQTKQLEDAKEEGEGKGPAQVLLPHFIPPDPTKHGHSPWEIWGTQHQTLPRNTMIL